MGLAAVVGVVGYLAWIGALAATAAGRTDAQTLAAAQTFAMIGTILIGVALLRAGDVAVGVLILTGAVALLVPWTVMWLVFGASWTAVGMVLVTGRSGWPGARWGAA